MVRQLGVPAGLVEQLAMTSRNASPRIHNTSHDGDGGWFMPTIEKIPVALLNEPLEYIFAYHFHQRVVLATLQHFAEEASASRADADTIKAFLTHDLVLHHADEDDDLFPLVRLRALPEDGLGTVLARLDDDHRRDETRVEEIVRALTRRTEECSVRLSKGVCEMIQSYVTDKNHHSAVENGVLLAIARIRLARKDLKAISRGMKARRGLTH
ncbi:MAG: hemerythrin domain-containing protein [Rhizobiales bacterium]|nr:hemerythrin domain-containing protein [Hyphomicrobiales bacterium]MBI3672622.1 hemerythrin domain-containing protein [Hyphomicrobiales bacterium]